MRRIRTAILILIACGVCAGQLAGAPSYDPRIDVDVITGPTVELPHRSIRVAAITLPEMEQTLAAIDETIELLRQAFAPHPVEFVTLKSRDLEDKIKRLTVDAFVSSPGFYWRLAQYGNVGVGTLISPLMPDPNNSTALAFVVRADDTRFATLSDLKGARASASFETAFMTYRIGLAEVARHGEDPERFFSQVLFTQNTDSRAIVSNLDKGLADVAMVKACWLESLPIQEQRRYRVLDEKINASLHCKHSTEQYPGIMMAVTEGAPPGVAHIIARTLLSTRTLSNGYRWGLATDMRSIDEVYRLLKIEQYAYLREPSLRAWMREHWHWLLMAAMFVCGLMLHSWRVGVLVRQRTAALEASMKEKERTQARVEMQRQRLENMHKASIVGQLSNMVAHELAQPLAAMQYWCDGQKDLLAAHSPDKALLMRTLQGIEKSLERTRKIVEKVRSYNRGGVDRSACVRLAQTTASVLAQLQAAQDKSVRVQLDVPEQLCVAGDALEIELMLYNLIKNALEAAAKGDDPLLVVHAQSSEQRVRLDIENSGPQMDQESFERLKTPLLSSKQDGLGLGVSIACAIAEVSGGHVQFVRRKTGGLRAVVTLNEAVSEDKP